MRLYNTRTQNTYPKVIQLCNNLTHHFFCDRWYRYNGVAEQAVSKLTKLWVENVHRVKFFADLALSFLNNAHFYPRGL